MLVAKPLVAALDHVLGQSAWAREKLQPFAGRHVRLTLSSLQVDFVIEESGGVQLAGSDTTPDVEILLPPETPLLALQGSDRIEQAVRITGSAEFAEVLGFVLRNLRWDIEEDLSKAVGDIAAHRVVGALDAFFSWQKQAAASLAENFTEYLTEERSGLVKAEDLSSFTDEVERLRSDLSRLENRIKLLGK